MKHTVIGYDIRVPKRQAAANWNERWRKEYLLRTNIQCPLSVDIEVWPSVFVYGTSTFSDGNIFVTEPSIRQKALGLWEDRREMLKRFRSATEGYIASRASAIRITVLSSEGRESPFLQYWTRVLGLTSPRQTKEACWEFLGFDVADRNLLSGLSNCGFDQTEADSLRANWVNKLNANGLFFDEQDVLRFRDISDKRCVEHSPFDIFGLFSIPLNEVA